MLEFAVFRKSVIFTGEYTTGSVSGGHPVRMADIFICLAIAFVCFFLQEFFMYPSPALIWFFAGVIFLIAELMMPAFILIFFTAGSWIAGLCAWLAGVSTRSQIIIFVCSSLFFLLTLRRYGLRTFKGTTRSDVEDAYADSKLGKTALVTTGMGPGREGEIKMQGSFWRAVADVEILEGESVVIEAQLSDDGLTFKVKPSMPDSRGPGAGVSG